MSREEAFDCMVKHLAAAIAQRLDEIKESEAAITLCLNTATPKDTNDAAFAALVSLLKT